MNPRIQHGLPALFLDGAAATHRNNFVLDGALANTRANFFLAEHAAFEILVHQRLVGFGGGFDQRVVPLLRRL